VTGGAIEQSPFKRSIVVPRQPEPTVSATSLSLLDRLRHDPTEADWRRLHSIYHPLVRGWLARVPGLHDEADDVTQDVLLVVVTEVPRFERQREGSFRTWLRRVTANRVREFWRQRARRPRVGPADAATEAFLDQLADPASDLSAEWDRDHDRHLFERLEEVIRSDFEASTWAAYRRFAVEGASADLVATELGLTRNAVVLAKSRVLRRLRQEAGVLVDAP
jgi:RNA polymerase sigma-70 factor (ECF subfamily)